MYESLFEIFLKNKSKNIPSLEKQIKEKEYKQRNEAYDEVNQLDKELKKIGRFKFKTITLNIHNDKLYLIDVGFFKSNWKLCDDKLLERPKWERFQLTTVDFILKYGYTAISVAILEAFNLIERQLQTELEKGK